MGCGWGGVVCKFGNLGLFSNPLKASLRITRMYFKFDACLKALLKACFRIPGVNFNFYGEGILKDSNERIKLDFRISLH